MGILFSNLYPKENNYPNLSGRYEIRPLISPDLIANAYKNVGPIMWRIVVTGPEKYTLVIQIPEDKEKKLDMYWIYEQASKHLGIDIKRFKNIPSGEYLEPYIFPKEMRTTYIEYV